MQWFHQSAAAGDAIAMAQIGQLYDKGLGVPRDYHLASHWYLKSATLGYAMAQYRVGQMYANGLGVPLDYVSAYVWFTSAFRGGLEPGRRSAAEVAQIMTPSQRQEAEARLATDAPISNPTAAILEMKGKARGLIAKEKLPDSTSAH
jgi:TPR repeat protein